jgi:peptide deformylase
MPDGAKIFVQGEPVDSYPQYAEGTEKGRRLTITEVGEDVLHRPCREVEEFGTAELDHLIADMFRTMYIADGVGLAANQVGRDLRLFVYDCPDDDGARHVGHIINPVVVDAPDAGRSLLLEDEGCLSVPAPHAELARPESAVVQGVDQEGRPLELGGTGFFARCLRHESDHLNGWLYIDRLSKRERKRVLQDMEERRHEVYAKRDEREGELDAYFSGP